MNAQTIALMLSLACWLASPLTLAAHGQISGTVSKDGTVTQNNHRASSHQPDLEAAADDALEHGEYRKAFSLFTQLCFADSMSACLQDANLLDLNADLDPDPFAAIPLYTRACDLGQDSACIEVKSAFAGAESQCEKGDAEACMASAFLQLHNLTEIPYAPIAAAQRFAEACRLDHGPACTELGHLYATGLGVGKDLDRADASFAKACSPNNADDCVRIGDFYLHGRPVNMDFDRAADYYEAGCTFGDTFSCQKIGYAYLTSPFVNPDMEPARVFLRRACDAGLVSTCNDIPTEG
ncbi:MAG: sel1 repeat family protein [Hyphomonas sp.]|nr:sel1 repeat family protein [Hyphomonas sp.]